MAKARRPRKDDPITHVVSVKFNNETCELMVEYAMNHDMSVSQMIRYGIEMQLRQEKNT